MDLRALKRNPKKNGSTGATNGSTEINLPHGLGGAGGFKWPRYRRWAGVRRWPHPAVMPRVALVLLPVSVDQQGW